MSLKIKIKDNIEVIILVFLFLMENCFYLINTGKINISGKFAYSDIWLVLYVSYFFLQFIKYCRIKCTYEFKWPLLILCVMTIVAAIQEMRLTGQNFNLGLRPQRNYLIILLSYFPIRKLFAENKIDINKLLKLLMVVGTLSASLYIFQKITYNQITFLNVMMNTRNGSLRMYIDSSLIHVAGIVALYCFCIYFKPKYMIAYVFNLVYVFWISQGRMELMSFLFASAIGVAIARNLDVKKMILLIVGMVAGVVFLSTPYADNLWNAIQTAGTASVEQGNTMAIRYVGRELYFNQLSHSMRTMLFGCGYPNELFSPAASKAGFYNHIYLNDNGIFGFTYIYGLIGVTAVILIVIKTLKIVLPEIKNIPLYVVVLMFFIMQIVSSYNVTFWYWKADGTFLLVIMLCIAEQLKALRLSEVR